MEKIISQSAIQTREDSTHKLERLFPLLAAEAVARIDEQLHQRPLPRIDFWNTYGLKTEIQFARSSFFPDREGYIADLINQRLGILSDKFQVKEDDRKVLTDDDPEIGKFVSELLQKLFRQGRLAVEEMMVICCENCDLVIAPQEVQPEKCKKCNQANFAIRKERVLVIKVSDELKNKLLNTNLDTATKKVVVDFANTAPDNIVVSKQREFGLSLENFDLDGKFKLDPKVTLALQGMIFREMFGLRDCTLVQGIDSLKNTLPLAVMLDENFATKFLPVGYIPKVDIDLINRQDPGFFMPFLAVMASGMTTSINSNQFNAFRRQFQKTRIKIENCLNLCKILDDKNEEEDVAPIEQDLMGVLASCDSPQRLLESTRKYVYETISGVYLPEIRAKGLKPSHKVVEELKQINRLFYGKSA
jgi:hypothetical protein